MSILPAREVTFCTVGMRLGVSGGAGGCTAGRVRCPLGAPARGLLGGAPHGVCCPAASSQGGLRGGASALRGGFVARRGAAAQGLPGGAPQGGLLPGGVLPGRVAGRGFRAAGVDLVPGSCCSI